MKLSNRFASIGVGLALACTHFAAAADTGSITILSPKDGAVIQSGAASTLEYNVHLSPNGNHLHVYVDDQNPIIVHQVSDCPCSVALPALSQGKHVILLREASSAHSPTGVQGSVTITAK